MQSALTSIGEIISFRDFPYGNANEKQNADGTWTFTCQHGVTECEGNMYEDCAIEHYNTTDKSGLYPTWWPFFLCMEKSGKAADITTASNCASSGGLDWNVIKTCAGSNPAVGSPDDGNPLMHKTALDTNGLQPPHQWTPWVVVNGQPLNEAQLDLPLIPIVCSAYSQSCQQTPPSGCSSVYPTPPKVSHLLNYAA